MSPSFIGRQAELKQLLELKEKNTASFVVVKGRRRIGKSRLIQEFGKHFEQYYSFIGLPPEKHTTISHQLNEFSRQIARQFNTSFARYDDWSDLLWAVSERLLSGKILLLFDEISWMGSKDPTFLGKIKNFWDTQLKNNNKLIFVVCGSASSWIEKNILSSTGFVGRISMTLTLGELALSDCNRFWPKNISAYEKFKVLAVTGGIPKYLEEVNFKHSAEENIKKLCFSKGGFLVEEFDQIFSDLFMRKTVFYKQIVRALSTGAKEQEEICAALDIARHGRISEYLYELELAGFITKDHTWNIKTGIDSRLRRYRLQDNYLRFYLKYIEKNLGKINRDAYSMGLLASLPEWHTIIGLQFENLVLNNRKSIHNILGIDGIVSENPFFQRKTSNSAGCQIDYMIQTKFNTLYICEIKFSKNKIGHSIIQEVQTKIDTLNRPKGFSCRPVLIHVNGVSDDVIDSDYFANIIDFGELLNCNTNGNRTN
ncbi:MAG: ATP-binding protein [Rickettsiales bacterium]|jgi:AAA+ ATPase superfamily predicted ATPase|nr:ATP-binding protein [Rickettsiales bacterium]